MRRVRNTNTNLGWHKRHWLAVVLVVLGLSVLGAHSFASQDPAKQKSSPLTQTAEIRTTPDAPRELPPPVEQPR